VRTRKREAKRRVFFFTRRLSSSREDCLLREKTPSREDAVARGCDANEHSKEPISRHRAFKLALSIESRLREGKWRRKLRFVPARVGARDLFKYYLLLRI
jgi:hypothetical protein